MTKLVCLVEVLPKLNVTGDPELERMAQQVRRSLLVDLKELRESETSRQETARAAAAIGPQVAEFIYQPAAPVSTVAA